MLSPRIRLQLSQPSASTPLNISLFLPTKTGSLGELVATSGPYTNSISGVATPHIFLKPGKYQLVPSTYNPGTQVAFQLIIYSTISGVNVAAKKNDR